MSLFLFLESCLAFTTGTRCWVAPAHGQGFYSLDPYPSTNLINVMAPATKENSPNLPSTLYGTWWFNNSEPTGLVSLAGMTQDPSDPAGLTYIPVPSFWEGHYSYDNSQQGVNSWSQSFFEDFYFKFVFHDQSKTYATVYPTFYGQVTSTKIAEFDIYYSDDNNWVRRSTGFGKDLPAGDYPVRRVVDGNGNLNRDMFDQWLVFNKQRSGSDQILLATKYDNYSSWASHCKSAVNFVF